MSQAEVFRTKEEALGAIAQIRQAAADSDGKIANLQLAVETLTTKWRDHAKAVEVQGAQVRPSGNDAEAFDRYTVDADYAEGRLSTAEQPRPIQYATDAGGGVEYAASRDAPRAIRLFSEWGLFGHRDPGLLDDPEPVTQWQHRLQDMVQARSMARMFLARVDSRGQIRMGATPQIDDEIRRHIRRGPSWVKQVFADNVGEGAEFIPDVVMPELSRKLELPRSLVGTLPTMQIPTGGATKNPFLVRGAQPFIVGTPALGDQDPADIQRSQPTTAELSITPRTWGVVLPASRDATEDSIIDWAAFGSMLLAEAIRDGEEDAVINADLNGGDTGLANWGIRSRWPILGNSLDHRTSFVGLRHHSIDAGSANALGAETALGVIAELVNLDSPHMVGDLVIGVSPEWLVLKLLTDPNLLTVDKFGDRATLVTGQVGAIAGHPVVMSEFIDKEYNASGIYDHVTRTKTGVLIFHRGRWARAVRRGPRVEAEVVARQHLSYLTLTQRWALRHLGQATEKSVTWQFNASTS